MAVTKRRHFAKAITWRVVATTITLLTTFFITGSLKLGLSISMIDALNKFVAYYAHERLWYRNKWGIVDL